MTKETWTPTEEAAFVALQERRERVQAAMKAGVTTLVDRHFTGMQAEAKDALFLSLTKHADDWRDALAPFDSGVRPEPPPVLTPSAAPYPGAVLPVDHRIGTPWPATSRPDPARKIMATFRTMKMVGPTLPQALAWCVTGEGSDIVRWHYAD